MKDESRRTNRWTRARKREVIADFQLPIVDLIRAAASTQPLACFACES